MALLVAAVSEDALDMGGGQPGTQRAATADTV